MKKLLFTLLLAAATLPGWATDYYLVGGATTIGWTQDSSDRNYTKLTETGENTNIFKWSGILKKNNTDNDGFKICFDTSYQAWCASSAGKDLPSGETETLIQNSGTNWGTNDYKFDVTKTGYYTITVDLSGSTKTLTAELIAEVSLSNDKFDKDGSYKISSSTDLTDFAAAVNSGATALNAKLVAEIDLSDIDYTPIGCADHKYKGTFNGQGHTIDHLVINRPTVDKQGIFGAVQGGATIQNLIAGPNNSIIGKSQVGGLIGFFNTNETEYLTIENCGNEGYVEAKGTGGAAMIGICYDGNRKTKILNCYNTGNIKAANEGAVLTGWFGGSGAIVEVRNFYNTGNVTGQDNTKYFYRTNASNNNITFENVYDGHDTAYTQDSKTVTKCTGVATGELCYRLNNQQGGTNWTQTIGNDNHPVPFSTQERVYNYGTSYFNDGANVTISNETDLDNFSTVVNAGATSVNATVSTSFSANVALIPIGTSSNMYKGTFDGGGNSITLSINNTDASVSHRALIGYATGGATIKNLILKGSVTSTGSKTAGFIAEAKGGGNITITNCGNEATITGAGGEIAAIIANNYGASCLFNLTNVYNIGDVTKTANDKDGVAAICAYCGVNFSVFKNVYNTGNVTGGSEASAALFVRNPATDNDFNHCYTKYRRAADDSDVTLITSSDVQSGKLCFLLNGDQADIKWKQTLAGIDNRPYLFGTHKQVYQISESSYTNIPVTSGNVQISNADELLTFAKEVNAGNVSMNAELTGNIDYSASAYRGQDAMIGTNDHKYAGTFDGKNHTVTVGFNNTTTSETALFRRVSGATIQNLKVDGNISTNQSFAAGICSCVYASGTIQNCESSVTISDNSGDSDATHGGILAYITTTAEPGVKVLNCLFSGTINASNRYGCAGVVGWTDNNSRNEVKNCLVTGSLNIKKNSNNEVIARWDKTAPIASNNYYTCSVTGLNTNADASEASAKKGTGELCYLLNGSTEADNGWYQNIDENNSYPVPFNTSKVVRQANTGSFTNLAVSDSKAQIGSEADLTQFSLEVNRGGNVNTNAVLTADIDMTSIGNGWWPIGYESNKYAGTFDGDKHEITFSVDYGESSSYAHQAMFGMVTNGASISNLIVKGKFRANSQVAGVVAYADGNGTVTLNNIMNYADIQATGSGDGANASGLVACVLEDINLNVTNCANLGTIRSGHNQSAAFVGWVQKSATFTNCWNIGDIYNIEGTNQLYRHGEVVNPVNCYDLTTFGEQCKGTFGTDAEKTGELCYKVNNGGSNWYQTLGTDNYPVPFSSSESVLAGQWFNSSENDVYYNKDASDNITVYQLNLNDTKEEYKVPAKVTAKNVKMTRTLHALTADGTTARWNTFCSPVAIAKSNFSAAKELTGVTANGNNYSMAFTDVEGDVLEAGKPYMVQVSETKSSLTASNVAVAAAGTSTSSETFYGLTFTGNFTNGNAPLGSFIISNNVFYLVDTDTNTDGISEVALKAFRGYITTASGTNVKALDFTFDDDATSLSSISSPEGKECIYNLAGQRINKMQKGINIVNGKKILF